MQYLLIHRSEPTWTLAFEASSNEEAIVKAGKMLRQDHKRWTCDHFELWGGVSGPPSEYPIAKYYSCTDPFVTCDDGTINVRRW